MEEYLSIIKRVGKVLVIVGLLDIGVMIYCIVNSIPYSSSFNIFGVIAGTFLISGSLRAAAIVSWLATLLGVLLVGFPFAFLLIHPLELTQLELRLFPITFVISAIVWLFAVALLYWVVTELRREPVLIARTQAGRRIGYLQVPLTLGVALLVILAISVQIGLKSKTGQLAKTKAMEKLGPSYKYVVSSLHISDSPQGRLIAATVTAYNDNEIRRVPVQWSEK